MLGRPRLLILDEPTNGMDPEGTQEVLSFLREKVRNDGLTIFISSHLMSEVEEFCDTVFVINQGHLVASGNVRELLRPHERIIRVTFQGRVPDAEFIRRHEQVRRWKPWRRIRWRSPWPATIPLAEPLPVPGRISGLGDHAETKNVERIFPFHHGPSQRCKNHA
jgi:ABC-type multidrug transport system ATPase subunit